MNNHQSNRKKINRKAKAKETLLDILLIVAMCGGFYSIIAFLKCL